MDKSLESLTVPQLKEIAEAMGIDIKGMKKDDLIEAIESNETKIQAESVEEIINEETPEDGEELEKNVETEENKSTSKPVAAPIKAVSEFSEAQLRTMSHSYLKSLKK